MRDLVGVQVPWDGTYRPTKSRTSLPGVHGAAEIGVSGRHRIHPRPTKSLLFPPSRAHLTLIPSLTDRKSLRPVVSMLLIGTKLNRSLCLLSRGVYVAVSFLPMPPFLRFFVQYQ